MTGLPIRCTAGVAAVAGVLLAGCGGHDTGPAGISGAPPSEPAAVSPAAEPPGGYDISRIATLADAFPAGYTVTELPRTTLTQEQADSAGGLGGSFPMTFDPPYCNTMLKAPHVVAGSQSQGLLAAGPQQITVMVAQSAEPNSDTLLGGGCDHVTVKIADMGQGSMDRLPGPEIPGVITAGVQAHIDMSMGGAGQSIDRTVFFAGLSDKTGIMVMGESDPKLLADLLVKGVDALRGS